MLVFSLFFNKRSSITFSTPPHPKAEATPTFGAPQKMTDRLPLPPIQNRRPLELQKRKSWCGRRYVEGCWGFPYLKKCIGFLVSWFIGLLVSWFLAFLVLGTQSSKYHDPLGGVS